MDLLTDLVRLDGVEGVEAMLVGVLKPYCWKWLKIRVLNSGRSSTQISYIVLTYCCGVFYMCECMYGVCRTFEYNLFPFLVLQ